MLSLVSMLLITTEPLMLSQYSTATDTIKQYAAKNKSVASTSSRNNNNQTLQTSERLVETSTFKKHDWVITEEPHVNSMWADVLNEAALPNEKSKKLRTSKEIRLEKEILQIKAETQKNIQTILISCASLLFLMICGMLYLFLNINKKKKLLADNYDKLETAENELAHKIIELQTYIESNLQLEQFAHVASHDLRSPIVTINSFAELLKNKAANKLNDEEQKLLNFIEGSSKQMLELVTDLLEYSKLNSQVLNIDDVEIQKLLEEVTSTIKPQAKEKNIHIETTGDYPVIKADVIKLKRVFQNLVSNSIKFSDTDKMPYVKISCEEDSSTYNFKVEDNGIGIKNSKVDLFAPYVQLNPKSDYNGTGLGLSMCKKIVEQHGGTIDYQGREGEGTVFSFSISKDLKNYASSPCESHSRNQILLPT